MARKCKSPVNDLINLNASPRNHRPTVDINKTQYVNPVMKRCAVDQLLNWDPSTENNQNNNIDDLLSYSPPPIRRSNLYLNEQPGIVHNLAQLHPNIRAQDATPSPKSQAIALSSNRTKRLYGPNLPPPEIKIEEALPVIPAGNGNKCTPIAWVDRKVRHKSNILGGDEENRARWIDIHLKFSFLKNSFDNLYSGLLLNLSGVRPPNQPWAIRPEPQKCSYEDGFREYPPDVLNQYLNNWNDVLDDENDVGQNFSLLGEEDCQISMDNVDGDVNMGKYLEYDSDDQEDGEVNLSIQILESKCITEINSESDEAGEQVC